MWGNCPETAEAEYKNRVILPCFFLEIAQMIQFYTLASSSSGNAALLCTGNTRILIDAGISYLRIRQALAGLGLSVDGLDGILITHAHTDHIAGMATMVKKKHTVPIHCSEETARQLCYQVAGVEGLLHPFPLGTQFRLGDCRITSIPTSHDSRGSTGYRVDSAGCSFGLLTDTGILPVAAQSLLGVDLLVLESNHDVETLRSGPYPFALKQRVLGDLGHLSNDMAAQFAVASARAGTGEIILAHLSKENNTPQMALNTVGRALEAAGWTGQLSVAPRDKCSRCYTVEAHLCSESW